MAPTRDHARNTVGTIRRSLNRSITSLFKRDCSTIPPRNPRGNPSFNTYGPITSATHPQMSIGSHDAQALTPFTNSNGNPIDPTSRPYHTSKDTWSRALSSRIVQRKKYANGNAKRAPVRPLFGLTDEQSYAAIGSSALATDSVQEGPTVATPTHVGSSTDAIEIEDEDDHNAVAPIPFQEFISTVPAHQETTVTINPNTSRDASTQIPENQASQGSPPGTASDQDAIELDAESTVIREATCIHFTQIGAPTAQRINTQTSTSSSRANLIIYPPIHQPLPSTPTPTSQRLPQQPENFGPLSPSLLHTVQGTSPRLQTLRANTFPTQSNSPTTEGLTPLAEPSQPSQHETETIPGPSQPSTRTQPSNPNPDIHPPSSPAKSWTTGRTTLDFHVVSRAELAQRRNFDLARGMWERVNAESIEQRLSGDTLIDGRTQHEELSGEPSGLDTNMPFFSAGANITPSIAVPAVVEIPLAASRQNTRGSTPTVDNPGEHEQGDDEQEAYERGLEHWARTTQNGERLRPGPGWVRRTSSFPRVSLRRAFN